jgi:hypothetical protein
MRTFSAASTASECYAVTCSRVLLLAHPGRRNAGRATDDYEQTRELVAVVRGSDGGRRMQGAGDALPTVYTERFRTQIYNERTPIRAPGTKSSWSPARTMTRRCSTTPSSRAGGATAPRSSRSWRGRPGNRGPPRPRAAVTRSPLFRCESRRSRARRRPRRDGCRSRHQPCRTSGSGRVAGMATRRRTPARARRRLARGLRQAGSR